MLIKIISNWFAVSSWKDVVDRTTWRLISALWRGSKQTTSNSWTRQSWFGLFRHSSLMLFRQLSLQFCGYLGTTKKLACGGLMDKCMLECWQSIRWNPLCRGGIESILHHVDFQLLLFRQPSLQFCGYLGTTKKLACGGLMDKCTLECWQSIRWNPLCRGEIESILTTSIFVPLNCYYCLNQVILTHLLCQISLVLNNFFFPNWVLKEYWCLRGATSKDVLWYLSKILVSGNLSVLSSIYWQDHILTLQFVGWAWQFIGQIHRDIGCHKVWWVWF